MADIRVQVDDSFMEALRKTLGVRTNTDVIQEALTLLNWAAEEKKRGRLILSTNHQGEKVERLAMRALSVLPTESGPQEDAQRLGSGLSPATR
jgi:hypothetical protein